MPTTVSKTRDMLVDVARQLFARMGVDNTTMNDIAQASCKGRKFESCLRNNTKAVSFEETAFSFFHALAPHLAIQQTAHRMQLFFNANLIVKKKPFWGRPAIRY